MRTILISIGDRVRFSADWLRSISCVSGTLPFARGTLTEFLRISDSYVIVRVNWDEEGISERVNLKNLERIYSCN